MVLTQLPAKTLADIRDFLNKMDACARELEIVAGKEYEAIRMVDGEQILALTDQRIVIHQCMARLEQEGKGLLARAGVPAEMSLEVLIDMVAGEKTAEFQALRRKLYERMIRIDRQSQENSLRLRAAYNVSTTILQHLGLVQKDQTYGRNISR